MSPTLLTTKAAAAYLGVSVAFLERDRWAGATVPFVRVGARSVRYRLIDLQNYCTERRVGPQSTALAETDARTGDASLVSSLGSGFGRKPEPEISDDTAEPVLGGVDVSTGRSL